MNRIQKTNPLRQTLRQLTLAALVLASAASLSGCEWLARASEKTMGKAVEAQYVGLDEKRLVIVVYADRGSMIEYPKVRQEVSGFITKQFQLKMPKVKLVRPEEVLRWQDDTDWEGLPVKSIGEHFSTQRVLYVEVGQYSTRSPGGQDLLQGRISATVKVYEVDAPGDVAAWSQVFDVKWPEAAPTDVTHSNDLVARRRVLETFSTRVVNSFHDHREMEQTVKEKFDN